MQISMDGMELESLNADLIPNMHHDFCNGMTVVLQPCVRNKKNALTTAFYPINNQIQEDGSYIVAFDTLSHFDQVDRNETPMVGGRTETRWFGKKTDSISTESKICPSTKAEAAAKYSGDWEPSATIFHTQTTPRCLRTNTTSMSWKIQF